MSRGFKHYLCGLVCYVRQKCNLSRSFNCNHKLTLMRSACARCSAGQNLASVGHVAAKLGSILIVDVLALVNTELTDFPALTSALFAVSLVSHYLTSYHSEIVIRTAGLRRPRQALRNRSRSRGRCTRCRSRFLQGPGNQRPPCSFYSL